MIQQQIDSVSYWKGYEDGMSSFNFDDLPATEAGIEVDGSSFGMDGISFSADSNNGWFDATIVGTVVVIGVLFAVTILTERWLRIRKEYFNK